MKIMVEIELTKTEIKQIVSNSLERVLNNAIEVGGEAESCPGMPAAMQERASTLWQDCEELKTVTMKMWNAVHNQIFVDKLV